MRASLMVDVTIQHQLMVTGATTAHLWVYAEGEGILLTVRRDDEVMALIREAWDAFHVFLDTDLPPPLSERDTVNREDPAWAHAAKTYLDAKGVADAADEAMDAARKALVGLSSHAREAGAGVSVVRLWKLGSVDYKKVPEQRGVDLDRYRGFEREEVRVTVTK